MLEVLRSVAHLDLSRTLMVGDRMNTDIEFGKRGGLLTLMVLTGVSTRAEVSSGPAPPCARRVSRNARDFQAEAEAEDSLQRPHKILPSLADVVALLDG
jgi:ribonucleotide monophosphatase NagD (HAD superfamily)